MFIIEDVTYNICDQKFHEFEIRKQNPSVYVIRKTLTQVAKEGKLMDGKRLYVDGHEVSNLFSDQFTNQIQILSFTSFSYLSNITA